jgi:hypothetical protein
MKYLSLILVMFLIGCGNNQFNPQPSLVYTNTYTLPNLPPIEPVVEPDLESWEHELPRDYSKPMVVKNITHCVNTPIEQRSVAWWQSCGEYPILNDTGIFIGFDQDNWYKVLRNFEKLKFTIQQYKQRIQMVDEQRANWRNENKKEQEKQ